MVKPIKFGVNDVATVLNVRKNDGHATVLLLGSRAGAFFRSEQFYEIVQHVSKRDFKPHSRLARFQDCYAILTTGQYDEADIYHVLRKSIDEAVITTTDSCLALLIQQGYFEEIITTNVDDSLERACVEVGMREGYDFEVCHPDQGVPDDEKYTSYRIIKVFGDMRAGKHAIKDRLFHLERNQAFKGHLERLLKRDLLIIGFDPVWDKDILRVISAKGQTLWFVNEENLSKNPLLSDLLRARQAKNIIYANGSYDPFVNTLYDYCLDKNIIKSLWKSLKDYQRMKQVQADSREQKLMVQQTFTHGYALLIGVGADLPITVDDATALYKLLTDPTRAGYPLTQVALLTETKADRGQILAAFDRLRQQTENDPDATVIVYFSGHGGKFSYPGQAPEYFLVPYGYDPSRDQETALSDQEFTNKIEAIRARKLIVLLDCCHAGGIPLLKNAAATFEKSPVPPSLLEALQVGSGRVVIASSRENEYSYTGTPYSAFTACLIEALSGKSSAHKDGLARILDVVSYLFDHVPQRTFGKQHIFVKKMLDLDDNFPLCYYAGGDKSLPNEPLPIPLPTPASKTLTAGQRQRLETKLQQLQESWNLLNKKIEAISQAEMLEHNAALKFQYQQQLVQEREVLKQIEGELDKIEQSLVNS